MNTNPPQDPENNAAPNGAPHEYGRIITWVARLRYLFAFAAMGTFVAAAVLLLYGSWETALLGGAALGLHRS